jgi:hypothetical protein
MKVLADTREWCPGRLHLSPDGRRRVALCDCEVAGVPAPDDWREPLSPALAKGWLAARRGHLTWARSYAAPWLSRRVRGVSSGDGIQPKRPDLLGL